MQPFDDILLLEDELEMPATTLPIRSVVVRVASGGVLISPLPEILHVKGSIDEFSTITDIVAPNLFHHLGVRPALVAFPAAQLWGAPGLQNKRKNIDWNNILTQTPWPYQEELAMFPVLGTPKYNEIVFLHKKSKTLIVQDVCFNLQNRTDLGAKIIFGIMGTLNRFAVSRLLKLFIRNQTEFEKSLQIILAQDFDNLIMAHGEIILGGAKEKMRRALVERGLTSFMKA